MPPRVTVVIPTLNQAHYLRETLRSIEAQEYPSCDVVIIDGGSSDETESVVKEFGDLVSFFVSEVDEGQSNAVNKAITAATGEYFIWQNSDDVFLPDAFFRFEKTMNKYPGYDIYFGNTIFIDGCGDQIGFRNFCDVDDIIAYYGGLICNNQSAFMRREAVDKYGILDEKFHYAMDRELYLRWYKAGAKFKFIPFFISAFRYQIDSKTMSSEAMESWKKEHLLIANQYGLYRPGSANYNMMRVIAMLDKALRLLLQSPRKFINSLIYKIKN